MDCKRVSDELNDAWKEVSRSWDAMAKAEYHKKIFIPLTQCVYEIEQNNNDLERYAFECISSCR